MLYLTKIESTKIRLKTALKRILYKGADCQTISNFDMQKSTYVETWICCSDFMPIFKGTIFLINFFYILVPDFLDELFHIFIGAIFLMTKKIIKLVQQYLRIK